MDDQTTPRPPRPAYKVRTMRVLRTHISVAAYRALFSQAALRGWSIEILATELLAKIAQDNLTNAVLDDEVQPVERPR